MIVYQLDLLGIIKSSKTLFFWLNITSSTECLTIILAHDLTAWFYEVKKKEPLS